MARGQSWGLLPNSPSAGFRNDDLYFINADTGWVVNVDGFIYKTTDGGDSWKTQLNQPAISFRCVGFANSLNGWAGNLGVGSWSPTIDTSPLYQTIDGGSTWKPVTTIEGPTPTGICSISVVDHSVAYAAGRVRGPCYFMKTTNGGASWVSKAFAEASGIIDCHFFSADTGLLVGSIGPINKKDEQCAIFYTTTGGESWQLVYASTRIHGYCWKISFPSRSTGYVSVEVWEEADSIPVLKTTEGGKTWVEKLWSIPHQYQQGIGFVNDSLGWCGHRLNTVRQTTDGGDSWTDASFVQNFNRLRRINDTLAYASGNRIWKYSKSALNVSHEEHLPGLVLEQNSPNPFVGSTTIRFTIPYNGDVGLRVYDLVGRPVQTLAHTHMEKGVHEYDLHLPYYFDAPFYYTLYFDGYFLTRKMMMRRSNAKP